MRYFMRFWIMTILIVVSTQTSEAVNWNYIGDTQAKKIYIDSDSVLQETGIPKEAWFKYVEDTPDCKSSTAQLHKKCVTHQAAYYRFFSNKSMCLIQGEVYFSDGTKYSTAPSSSCIPTPISPKSIGELMWEAAYKTPDNNALINRTSIDPTRWTFLLDDVNATSYLDKASITKINNDRVEVWERTVHKKPVYWFWIKKYETETMARIQYTREGNFCASEAIQVFSDGTTDTTKMEKCIPSNSTSLHPARTASWKFVFEHINANPSSATEY